MSGELGDRARCEHVGRNRGAAKGVGGGQGRHKTQRTALNFTIPTGLFGLISSFITGNGPRIVVGQAGAAKKALWQILPIGVGKIIREANDAAAHVHRIARLLVGETLGVVEKDNRIVAPAERGRRTIEHGDGLAVTQATDRICSSPSGGCNAQALRLRRTNRADNVSGGDFGAVVEQQTVGAARFGDDLLHPALHAALAAGVPVFIEQNSQDHAHAIHRTSEAFEEERLEHDHELAELHVVLAGAAVIHHRTEQHILQQRIRKVAAHHGAGALRHSVERDVVVGSHQGDKGAEAVDLNGELLRDLRLQHGEVIGESQRGLAARSKGDA